MPDCYFEDLHVGDVRNYGRIVVDREEMLAFAREFDPQPFHLDDEAAKSSFIGKLIASGWYVGCLHMRMMTAETLPNPGIMGAPGIDEMKWLKPVVAGDILSGRRTIMSKRISSSRPDRGVVQPLFEVLNQDGEVVMSQLTWEMFALREPGAAPRPSGPKPAATAPAVLDPAARPAGPLVNSLSWFEDIEIGAVTVLGEKTFNADEIIAFARSYDPQSFHIDREAAKRSHFGGLIASGWHTACGLMGCLIRSRLRMLEAAVRQGGGAAPRLGPSPGFQNLRWIKPAREGDTIRYYSQVMDKRLSASRPEWGIVHNQGSGYNQHGERVFEFTGAVFWERRRP